MVSGQFVRTKIVCTIGPASNHPKTLGAMVDAGMDVARLNLSYQELLEKARQIIGEAQDLTRFLMEKGLIPPVPGERA